MKVLMIFSLFLVCSTQALFLKHFEKKFNAISGWFSTDLDTKQLERSDQQEHGEDAGPDQNELFKVSRRQEELEPETESSETKPERSGIRESRCRTVDTKVRIQLYH